ncbi:MAG: glutamine synthetase family protein [Armatimonadota bacterium]|nr:glutamine synthetase family protein [Armatimonadota bacterium]
MGKQTWATWAQEQGIRFVRFTYCDNANLIRAKAVPAERLDICVASGVGFSVAQQALPLMYDAVLPESGLGPVGEVWLMPDMETLTVLPYAPGAAVVLGDFHTAEGRAWEHCPRTFLRRMSEEAAAAGLRVEASFETEFYLFRQMPEEYRPLDDTVFAQTLAFDLTHDVLLNLLDTLQRMGLEPQLFYPESGPGQFELTIRHAPALQAADRQVLFREVVRGVAARHHLVASFAPKPLADKAGSGAHLHLSLWRQGQNALYDPADPLSLSEEGYWFIGGLLEHLPALCALTVPSVNSYRRIRPQFWAGAFTCYGQENREAAVRVITPRRGPESMNFELKTCDASANPYLALGAVIAAGLDGIRRRRHPGDPVEVDPASLSVEERRRRGILPLPASLGDAIAALQQDQVLWTALGEPLGTSYLAVRRGEWLALKDVSVEEEIRQHLMRY